jgi:hypothetical protein
MFGTSIIQRPEIRCKAKRRPKNSSYLVCLHKDLALSYSPQKIASFRADFIGIDSNLDPIVCHSRQVCSGCVFVAFVEFAASLRKPWYVWKTTVMANIDWRKIERDRDEV